MYKRIDFSKLEGIATYQDTLEFLQASYRDAIAGIAAAFGPKVIISGVEDLGSNYGGGWVVIDGELLPFIEGLKDTKVIIEELTDDEVYGDDSVQTVYFTRRAKCGSEGDLDFSSFVRLTALGSMSTTLTALVSTVEGLINVPTGSIKMFGGVSAPTGYLLCQGQAVSRTTYAALFGIIGTTYGVGDGTTTFNLPNMKGKFVVGYDDGDADYNALGKTGGSKKHTLTTGELPSHNHSYRDRYFVDDNAATHLPSGGVNEATGGGISGKEGDTDTDNVYFWAKDSTTGNAGSGQSHENRPPFIALNYIIKI